MASDRLRLCSLGHSLWQRSGNGLSPEKAYDTHERNERAALKEMLSGLELEGVIIQTNALYTTQAVFDGDTPRGRRAPND